MFHLDTHSEIGELVVSPDVGVVGGQGHEEVDEGDDHQGAGHCGQDEHHLGEESGQITLTAWPHLSPLYVVYAELFDLELSLHQQVHLLSACIRKIGNKGSVQT